MAKSLEALGLKDEALPTAGQDLGDLPEFGTFTPPPQPGPFRFKLPTNLTDCFDVMDVEGKGQRVVVLFDRDHPLQIVQSRNGTYNGQPFETRINNKERNRGKKDSGIIASDFDYLLRGLGEKAKPANNKEYIKVLQKHPGQEFGADIRYSWRCSEERDIRTKDAAGAVQVVEGHKGCGSAFYQEDVPPNADGTVPTEIQCTCGAILRAFANLDNIRA